MIYTIGYEKLDHETLARIMRKLDATILDVRSRPYGRVRKGWDRKSLTERYGLRYAGNVKLGGFARDNAAVKERVEARNDLAFLHVNYPGSKPLILMCQEYAPHDCHRHHDIAYPLYRDHKVEVKHLIYTAENEPDAVEVVTAEALDRSIAKGKDYPCDWIDL